MGNKIFVGDLNWYATGDDLRETFGVSGTITDAVVLKRIVTPEDRAGLVL